MARRSNHSGLNPDKPIRLAAAFLRSKFSNVESPAQVGTLPLCLLNPSLIHVVVDLRRRIGHGEEKVRFSDSSFATSRKSWPGILQKANTRAALLARALEPCEASAHARAPGRRGLFIRILPF